MPDTNERQSLRDLVMSCERCHSEFFSNVAVIADDELGLLDRQVPSVLAHLTKRHELHVEEGHVH